MRKLTVLCALVITVHCRYVPDNTKNVPDHVEETQHAVCKVATEEIQASANASITRHLKGVCSTQAMNSRFEQLERMFVGEVEILKLMLQSAGYTTPRPKGKTEIFAKQPIDYEDYDYWNEVENYTQATVVKNLEYTNRSNTTKQNYDNKTLEHKAETVNGGARNGTGYLRDAEVVKYNETVQTTDLGKAFLYYWRVYDVTDILTQDVYLTSPTVDFLGQMLHVQFSSRHLGTKYVNIELVSSGLFLKVHRFVLLHRDAGQDLNSQLLGNVKTYATSFRISQEKIRAFIDYDSLLMKLLIYLHF